MIARSVFALGLLVLTATGCLSLTLGDVPYRCGEEEPVCPESYECLESADGESYCVAPGAEVPGGSPDGAGGSTGTGGTSGESGIG